MKRGLTLLAVTAILFGMSMQAQATPISLTPTAPSPVLKGNDTSQSAISAIIEGAYPGLQEFYKAERNPPDELGPAALWYKATWGVPAPQGSATISWEGPGWISASPAFALIKGGNYTNYAWYFFDITGWNGKDDIEFTGFYGGDTGKISHVTLYGKTATVPDGGSVAMMLGAALIGLAGFRRMLK